MAQEVNILKSFRDNVLLPSVIGKTFVKLYYHYSPPIADFIAKHDSLKSMVRLSLLPVVGVIGIILKVGPAYSLALMFLSCSGLIGLVGFIGKFKKEKIGAPDFYWI